MGNGENGSGEEIKIIPWIVLRLRVGKETKPVEFRDDVLHLGRSSECEVYVHDKKASRKHAMIRRSGQEVTLFDLGSLNGTKLNGEKIRKAELNKGDRIKIGQTEIEVVSMIQPRGKKEIPKDNPFLNALMDKDGEAEAGAGDEKPDPLPGQEPQ